MSKQFPYHTCLLIPSEIQLTTNLSSNVFIQTMSIQILGKDFQIDALSWQAQQSHPHPSQYYIIIFVVIQSIIKKTITSLIKSNTCLIKFYLQIEKVQLISLLSNLHFSQLLILAQVSKYYLQDIYQSLMRIIVQRVFQAWVKVAGKEISHTKEGILILLGVTKGDTIQLAQQMAIKALNMRLWQKEGKSWAASVMDIGGEIMVVSQFTLYAIMKGNKPDFHGALQAEKARQLYQHFVKHMKKKYNEEKIQTGKFQTLMQVGSVINGPVTIQYEKNAQQQKKQVGKIQAVEKKQKKQEPPKQKDSKKSNKHRNRQQSPQIKTNEDLNKQQAAQIKQQAQNDKRQGQ